MQSTFSRVVKPDYSTVCTPHYNISPQGTTMSLITKSIVARTLASDADLTIKEATELVGNVYSIIANEIASGNDVKLDNVGTIKQIVRAARTGHNPATGASLAIPAKKTIKLKPFANIKAALNS